MTQKEVEIQTTETDTISICDGCGRGSEQMFDAPVGKVGEDNENFGVADVEPLHFCSESCVDSVRATGRSTADSSVGVVQSIRNGLNRLWSPYGNRDTSEYGVGDTIFWGVAFSAFPVVGMVMLLLLSVTEELDRIWRAFLVSAATHAVLIGVLLL